MTRTLAENLLFASLAINAALKLAGRDLDDIRRLLGHGDLRMTQWYAKITDPHLAKAADALDGVLMLPSKSAV